MWESQNSETKNLIMESNEMQNYFNQTLTLAIDSTSIENDPFKLHGNVFTSSDWESYELFRDRNFETTRLNTM